MHLRSVTAFLVITALASSGCSNDETTTSNDSSSSSSETSSEIASGRPYAVDQRTETFVDSTRPTVGADGTALTASRTLETEIYTPQGKGPFPLIVHAHGLSGHPDKFTELASGWVSNGYVVAMPEFPLTSNQAPGGTVIADYVNQPDDVSFVIYQLLTLSEDQADPLAGMIDPNRIGVSGLSLGGGTVWALVSHSCCRDPRIKAAIVMSGLRFPFEGTDDFTNPPVLLEHLTGDTSFAYETAVEPYKQARAPKFLITLIGTGHGGPFENTPSPHDQIATNTTLEFWDAWLLGDETAVDRLLAAAEVPDLSRIEHDLG